MPVLTGHAADPDAIPFTTPEAIAYDREAERLAAASPEPNASFAYGPDRGQRLDVYAPAGARGLPILLFFHGGAWVSGHLGWCRFMAAPTMAAGAILVGASYRLAPRLRWPAQAEDALAALRFVQAHAAEWGGDPDRIAIGGHSAGGQLASLVALTADAPRPIACFPVSAPFDLVRRDVPIESEGGRVYRFLFADRDQDRDASPLTHAADARAPFDIVWGSRDFDRVSEAGRRMVDALERAGKDVRHQVVDGGHFDTHLQLADAGNPWYARLSRALGVRQLEHAGESGGR